MNERVHAALDGELRPEALSSVERAELEAFETTAAKVRHLLAVPAPRGLAERIERGVAAIERPWRRRASGLAAAWQWMWAPRSIQLRPAHALAAAALAGLLAVWSPLPDVGADAAATAAVAEAPVIHVRFHIDAPGATDVRLAGSFSGWQTSYELHQTMPGSWAVVVPLKTGVHDYAFLVDGQAWVPDPHAPTVSDGFGGANSRLILVAPKEVRT